MATNIGSELNNLTSDELLQRATNLVPTLRSRAAHTEELRRIPEETVQDLLVSGMNLIEVPNTFGGLDVSEGLFFHIGE